MSDNHGGCIRAFSSTLAGDDTHRNWPAGVGASGMKKHSEHGSLPESS